jgi:hypothetical protein
MSVESIQDTEGLDPETLAAMAEAKDRHKKLTQDLVDQLCKKRDAVVRAKRHIEKRWIDDQRQWDGESRLLNTKEFPSQTNDDHLKPPRPHLTRSRCDLWESRMIDLLAPTNDPTWDLRPLAQEDIDTPQDVDPAQWQEVLSQLKENAEIAAQAMKRVIQDQMAACNATKVIRKMCRDACRIGTGLCMGPMNGIHIQRQYDSGSDAVKVAVVEKVVPEIREGDPWCFYPDMVENADKAEFAFYVHWMSQTDLYGFMDFPGVDKKEVLELIDEKPYAGEIGENIKERNQHSGMVEDITNRYPVWRYTGIVDKKYLDVLDLGENVGEHMISADIWFSNQHILKSKITMLSSVRDFRIPYYVYSPFPIDETMFGGSIPYMCRDSQRAAESAWLIGLHNASVSCGPQIITRPGKIRPKDGKYSIRGPKFWDILDENAALNDVMTFVNIPNNAEQAFEIFERAKQLMDEELNTQQWASPDTSEEQETASGMAMVMNARTILQRRVAATADDDIFRPMIERFVLWNLLWNKRQDIKGNYDVLPLCQSVRLVKDIQIQQKLFVATQLAGNPMFQGMFSPYDMLKDIIRDLDVQVDNWMVPKQQWQQAQQQQQQDPKAQLAASQIQLNEAKAKTEQAKQAKTFNDSQTAGQQQADQSGQAATFGGVTPDAALKHQEFLTEKTLQIHQINAGLAQNQNDNQTQRIVAAMKAQQDKNRTASTFDANARRERTELAKTGTNASVQIHKINTTTPKPAAQPKLPQGTFTAPKVPRYGGGKRPGY